VVRVSVHYIVLQHTLIDKMVAKLLVPQNYVVVYLVLENNLL